MAWEMRSDLSSCLSFLGPFGSFLTVVAFFLPFSFLTGVFLVDFLVAVAAFFFLDPVVVVEDEVEDLAFFFLGGGEAAL